MGQHGSTIAAGKALSAFQKREPMRNVRTAQYAIWVAALIGCAFAPVALAQTCATGLVCDKDFYVKTAVDTACTACPAGTERAAGDVLGTATACTAKADFYV